MKRRNFIRSAAATSLSIPLMMNGLKVNAMAKSSIFNTIDDDSDRVLVLIQLTGGNDGLNTFIPIDQYENLADPRWNILIPENKILKVDETIGFHPVMEKMKGIYDDGRMGIIQAVGYPDQNRSHFRSTDIWETGSASNEVLADGWLGRYFENTHAAYPSNYPNSEYPDPFALTMSSIVTVTCQGTEANFSLAVKDPFALTNLSEFNGSSLYQDIKYGEHLSFLRTSIAQTNAYGEVVYQAAQKGSNTVNYSTSNSLSEQLKNVALLISGGLKTKVYVVKLGGFDTHASQVVEGDPTRGVHATLLETLSTATSEFMRDIQNQGLNNRVLAMTFSEFGRRIYSNGSLGTDHGNAAPLMLFGDCVRPGFMGTNPQITDATEQREGVQMQYDFRNVYGSVLKDWFDVEEEQIKSILFDDFQYIPVIQNYSTTTSTELYFKEEILVDAYPNSFTNWITIQLESIGEPIRLSIFNTLGHEVAVVVNKTLSKGKHNIQFDGSQLPAGQYYYRVRGKGNRMKTGAIVKL